VEGEKDKQRRETKAPTNRWAKDHNAGISRCEDLGEPEPLHTTGPQTTLQKTGHRQTDTQLKKGEKKKEGDWSYLQGQPRGKKNFEIRINAPLYWLRVDRGK